jgi:hypothetical protein
MPFVRFFLSACQDVFLGARLPVLSIAPNGLSCQLVLGQATYKNSPRDEERKLTSLIRLSYVRSRIGCLAYLKQFSCLLSVKEASYRSTEVKKS